MSTHRALGLFDQDTRHRKLESLGDPLVVLNRIIPWEIFREPLEAARPTKDRSKGGRPPYDAVLMFKILVLRELYALSDEQVEFQVADRLSFQRFVGIGIEHPVPDYTAVWRFRERLKGEPIQALFDRLNALIEAAGFKASQGQMLDASLVQTPKRRKPVQPEEGDPPLTPMQAAHREGDADWTKKHGRSYFGYKNHINADVAHGFIRRFAVTPASVHDSRLTQALLDTQAKGAVFADSAYRSQETTQRCHRHSLKDRTMYKAQRNRPLTKQQQSWNRSRAKIRARVEHCFARIYQFRGYRPLHCVGLERAHVQIGLINLTHNLRRLTSKHRQAMLAT